MTPSTGVSAKGSNVLSNLLMKKKRKGCLKEPERGKDKQRDRQTESQTDTFNTWTLHWAALTPSTGVSAKGSNVLSNLLMNKRRKECYEEIEGKRDRQTEKQTQTYLNIALGCNNSIHRCLSKRVNCFVKPPQELMRGR
jgi:hypothetical protein